MTKEVKFYTVEEQKIMKQHLSTGQTRRSVARKLAIMFNRTEYAVYQKLARVKVDNVKLKPEALTLASIRAKKELQDSYRPIVEQQPAEVGINVPHGMTFEGKPKRISLHSDHFRIYF